MRSIVVILGLVVVATSAPIDWDDDFFSWSVFPSIPTVNCTTLGCPSEANSCSKETKTSKDKQTIDTTVTCMKDGTQLDQRTSSAANPNPNTQLSEFEYYGNFSGGSQTINIENNNGDAETITGRSTVEDLSK